MEQNVLEKALQKLNEQIQPEKAEFTNGVLTVKGIEFGCIVKGNITNANANIVLRELLDAKRKKPLLLIAEFIYPSIMEEFAKQGFNVLDSSGNCNINTPKFFLKIKGQKSKPAKERKMRAFQETGLKLIFFLLRDKENVNLPYRTIAERTHISLGSIKKAFEDLAAQNFILVTETKRLLKERKRLLEMWIPAYQQTLKPKLLLDSFAFSDSEKQNAWREMQLPVGMAWGGEAGANLIDNYLYPGAFEIYTDISAKMLLKTGFVTPKEDGIIKVYQRFWIDNQEENIAPALLIYADLIGSGNSRCIEAAQRIYDNEFADFE